MATLTWVAVGTTAWLTCAVLVGGLCMAAAYGDAVDSQTVPVVPATAELALPDGLPQSAAEALEDLTVGVAQALGIDSVCVFMRDPGDPRHCLIAAGVRLSPGLIGRRYGSDQGVVGKALTTGRSVLATDDQRLLGSVAAQGARPPGEPAAGPGAIAAVPLLFHGAALGAVCVVSNDADRPLRLFDLRVIERLADVAAPRLRHARRRHRFELLGPVTAAMREHCAALDEHCRRVAVMATQVGAVMGLDSDAMALVEQAARVHDVGMVSVPAKVLQKRGALNRHERSEIEAHPAAGYQLLRLLPGGAELADVVEAHHGRPDGGGYPQVQVARPIPRAARIIAVCEAYDVLVHDQPYRAGCSSHAAQARLQEARGTQFDGDVLDALTSRLERVTAAEITELVEPVAR